MAGQTSTQLPKLYKEETPRSFAGKGGLAKIYRPANGGLGYVNVAKDYTWTLTPPEIRETAPVIVLKEYEVNESAIKRQLFFYGSGALNFLGSGDILSPYTELFPKDRPTGFIYQFPYFTETNFEVTSQWQSLDTLEQGQKFVENLAGLVGLEKEARNFMTGLGNAAAGVGSLLYPKVGIMDRPKLWSQHDFRVTTVSFTLFNTYNATDWKKNRELCKLLVNQNLFNKRDFITGIPPVFYELYVPGQHYSIASFIEKLTVRNRGNMRREFDEKNIECNVPDAYQVEIVLKDMVMPSKNLFQSLENPKVTSSVFRSGT